MKNNYMVIVKSKRFVFSTKEQALIFRGGLKTCKQNFQDVLLEYLSNGKLSAKDVQDIVCTATGKIMMKEPITPYSHLSAEDALDFIKTRKGVTKNPTK